MFHFRMAHKPSRRFFLQTMPIAAAVLSVGGQELFAAEAPSQDKAAPVPFQLFPASALTENAQQLHEKPGNDNLFTNATLPVTIVLSVETDHAAKEFEWHEGRDHIVQVLDGSTVYELGGTPQYPRNTRPSEWLAPSSTGATTLTLHKGDMLLIPRRTPHKRTTRTSVTFYLISTTGK